MNTTQTLEPHYPTLSEVASLLCSVDSVKIPFFVERICIGTRRGAPQIFCICNTTTPSTIDTSANPPRPSRTPTSMPCWMARGSLQNQGDIPLCLYDRGLGLHTIKMGTGERGAIDHQGIGRFEIDPVSNRFGSWQRSHVQHIWQRPHTQQMWKKLHCVDGVMKIHDITGRLKELLGGHNESNGVLMLENLQTSYTGMLTVF
jgi:hypothetical protein